MRLTNTNFKQIQKLIDQYSIFNPSPMSIKKFMDFGRAKCEKKSFLFLKKELPVRLANIMQEISLLPDKLLKMPSVNLVQSWYERSFEEILKFESINQPQTSDLDLFCETLVNIRNRHNTTVQTMAEGVLELKEAHNIESQMEHSIQYFLNRFYMCRISIRMLINQHATLFGMDPSNPKNVGIIDPNCDVNKILVDAYENSRFLCEQYYLMCPEIIVEQHNSTNSEAPISFVYVPSHLYHMLFELFKNALRAVVETHGDSDNLPPIKVLLTKGKEDVTIKISDRGGGITRSESSLVFNYLYSTAPKPSSSASNIVPFAGLGHGLPLSRLYSRYFHGDLILNSYEGYGTDAIIYLKVLSSEANELLPIFNKTSSKHYRFQQGNHDWSTNSTTISKNKSSNDFKTELVA